MRLSLSNTSPINPIETGAYTSNTLNKAPNQQSQQLAQNQQQLHSSLTSSQQQSTVSSSHIVHEERTSSSSTSSSSKRINIHPHISAASTKNEGQQLTNAQSSVSTRSNELSEYSIFHHQLHTRTHCLRCEYYTLLYGICRYAMRVGSDKLRPQSNLVAAMIIGKGQIRNSIWYTISICYRVELKRSIGIL